jgi:hypothetical protein
MNAKRFWLASSLLAPATILGVIVAILAMSWLLRGLIPAVFALGFGLVAFIMRRRPSAGGQPPRWAIYLAIGSGALMWLLPVEAIGVLAWVAIGALWALVLLWAKYHPIVSNSG